MTASRISRVLPILGVVLISSCVSGPAPTSGTVSDPRLALNWNPPRTDSLPIGVSTLVVDGSSLLGRVYVPTSYAADVPMGLLVLLHGAGGNSTAMINGFSAFAEAEGILLLAPESRFQTWDLMVAGVFNFDIDRIGEALEYVLRRSRVDAARLWVGGHSDGATYSLSLGLANGDHFSKIVAFSPGFLNAPRRTGLPAVRIMHGTNDGVLPFTNVRDLIVPQLQAWGYPTTLEPHDGGHGIPVDVAEAAFAWLAAPPAVR